MEYFCRNPSLGFTTKAKRVTRARARKSVKECEDENSHPQVNPHFGNRSLGGLSTIQKAIVEVKTPCIEDFFYIIGNILKYRCLKWARMTHLDICNTSYGKKKVGSQTGSLITDHKKSGINPTPVRAGGLQHTIG
jgi:hypothetical protein